MNAHKILMGEKLRKLERQTYVLPWSADEKHTINNATHTVKLRTKIKR